VNIYFKKKFCWKPAGTYKSAFYRNGYSWFSFVYIGINGKAYKSLEDLIYAKWELDGISNSYMGGGVKGGMGSE